MWAVWLLGHAALVAPPVWAYLVDGYSAVPNDVRLYAEWGRSLVAGDGLPSGDDRWQYPPGAAVLFALPAVADRLVGLPYPAGFVVGMLLVDVVVTAVLLRRGSVGAAGLWALGVWAVGQVSVARFDLVPAGLTVVALAAASERRWGRAGWAAGVGALVKVWPVLALVAIGRDRRYTRGPGGTADGHVYVASVGERNGAVGATRGTRDLLALGAGLATAVAGMVAVAVAAGWWRDLAGFLGAQQARGLQVEAVAATPFVLVRAFGAGEGPAYAYGSMQFASPLAQLVATGCSLVGAVVVVGAAAWWWGLGLLNRSQDFGPSAAGPSVADRCFVLLALVVVTSRVLSPQYLLWLLAAAACRPDPWDSGGGTPWWRRPAAMLLAAALLSQLVYPMTYDGLLAGELIPSLLLAARNVVLVALCVFAASDLPAAKPAQA